MYRYLHTRICRSTVVRIPPPPLVFARPFRGEASFFGVCLCTYIYMYVSVCIYMCTCCRARGK